MKVKLRINLLWLLIIISNTAWAINVPTLYSPSNNSTSINTSISLICNIVNSITDYNNYTFELDTTPNFNSPAYVTAQGDYYNYAYIYKHNSGLLYDTTYYWRVKVTDGTNTSQWSDTWSFTTIYKLDLYSPSNNSTDITTTNTLYCNAENNNTAYANYDFELDTIPSFNSPLHQITNGNYYNYGHIYNPNSNLLYGTTYYWRVRVRNANDTSQWSDTWIFTTMAKPDLYSPSNNSTDITTTNTLYCNAENNNTAYANYDFELDTIPSFNSPLHQITNGNYYNYGHIYNPNSNLLYGTTYYWRVRVRNANDTSQWSDTWIFTTMAKPDLYSPTNNSTDITTTNTLYCNAENTNTAYANYDFELDTIPSFNSPLHQITNGNYYNYGHIYNPNSNLLYGTTYYWRVRVRNANDTSQWSDTWSFTTMAKLDLYSPANNSTDISINPSLRCNAESSNTAYANYDFEIDTIPSFNSPLHQMTNGNNYNYGHIYNDISNLLYGTTYYWRVRVKNTNDTSQWSDTWRFTTDYEMTNAPDLVSPVNNSTDIPYSSFSIEWNSISNANAYQYQISTTNDFSNIVKSGNASLTNKTITNLQAYTLYYWRVRGENNNGYSPWSNVWNFTTDQNSNIDDATNQSAIKLYPNPANDIISISGFEHISNVEIYNVIGKQMKIVSINGVKKTINIKELEKGIYFVKFISDKSLITEILIKK